MSRWASALGGGGVLADTDGTVLGLDLDQVDGKRALDPLRPDIGQFGFQPERRYADVCDLHWWDLSRRARLGSALPAGPGRTRGLATAVCPLASDSGGLGCFRPLQSGACKAHWVRSQGGVEFPTGGEHGGRPTMQARERPRHVSGCQADPVRFRGRRSKSGWKRMRGSGAGAGRPCLSSCVTSFQLWGRCR